ncbi:MAG: CoA transferase [Actinomycetota bacterium]
MDQEFADRVTRDQLELARSIWNGDPLAPIEVRRDSRTPVAASAFDVDRLLGSTAGFATAELAAFPDGHVDQHMINLEHLVAWTASSVRVDGAPVPQWAELSGMYETGDRRHLQIHANFPHHAAGVIEHLGTSATRDALAAAIAERDGEELETELIERGMVAALVRDLDQWSRHPHAAATDTLPLVTVDRIGDAPGGTHPSMHDLRVLDCSRVLAGPVAGQLFATAGADVLRVGAAHLPTVEVGVLSTGFGKRNTDLDLRTRVGRAAMDELLGTTDVWIDAYRPGALSGLGVDPRRAAELRPGIVIVQISAFDAEPDTRGPWAGRRGHDSIVQSTTGVRAAGGTHAVDATGDPLEATPRGLPVQALDHATGFLAAGVAARLVARQRAEGGSWLARLSLLRTRNRLVALGGPATYTPTPVDVGTTWCDTVTADIGRVTAVRPFVGRWTGPPMALGSSRARWRR